MNVSDRIENIKQFCSRLVFAFVAHKDTTIAWSEISKDLEALIMDEDMIHVSYDHITDAFSLVLIPANGNQHSVILKNENVVKELKRIYLIVGDSMQRIVIAEPLNEETTSKCARASNLLKRMFRTKKF